MKTLLIIIIHLAFLTPQLVFGQEKDSVSLEDKRVDEHIRTCNQKKYSKYSGKIEICKMPNYVYYELDSVRILIYYNHLDGFLSKNDSVSKNCLNKFHDTFGQIFEQGFVTGKMFICELFEDCNSTRYIQWFDSLFHYTPVLFKDTILTIKILNIEERSKIDTKSSRIFEIWTARSKMPSGSNGFDVYYLELNNEKAENDANLEEFIKGARLKCFRYAGTQI